MIRVACQHAEDVHPTGAWVTCRLGLGGGRPHAGVCAGCGKRDGAEKSAPWPDVPPPVLPTALPKLLHFVWLGGRAPDWTKAIMARWQELNPDYTLKLHGRECVWPAWQALYDRLWRWDERSDLVRLTALRQEGGWYADLDMVPLKGIEEISRAHRQGAPWFALLGQDLNACSGLCAAPVDSPLWGKVDELMAAGQPGNHWAWSRDLFTAIWRRAPGHLRLLPLAEFVGSGHHAVAEATRAALAGPLTDADVAPLRRCGHCLPSVVHVGTRGGHARQELLPLPEPRAVALLRPMQRDAFGGALMDAADAAGVSLLVRGDGANYKADYAAHQNIITWGCKMPPGWYARGDRNVLYMENGLLGQQAGVFLDVEGYWTDSEFVREQRWAGPVLAQEVTELEAMCRRCFGVTPWTWRPNDGPVLVALQYDRDAPCHYYFPARGQRSAMSVFLELCARHLPADVPVLVRPHPRFLAQWQERETEWRALMRPGWQVDAAGNVYALLARCRALVTVNSTLATEAQLIGTPVATLGEGTFTGSGTTLECARAPARLAGLADWRPDQTRSVAYLANLWSRQLPYGATAAQVVAHPAVRTWLDRCEVAPPVALPALALGDAPEAELCLPAAYQRRPAEVYFDDRQDHTERHLSTPLGNNPQQEAYHLAAQLSGGNGARVLDIGCGGAWKLLREFPVARVTGLDVAETVAWLKQHHPQGDWRVADFEALPRREYDVVTLVDSLEHFRDPMQVMRYAMASLARGGVLVASTPARQLLPGDWFRPLGPPKNGCHVQEWDTAEFGRFLGQFCRVETLVIQPPWFTVALCRPRVEAA
jgi:SAM-dependent methyltransferase